MLLGSAVGAVAVEADRLTEKAPGRNTAEEIAKQLADPNVTLAFLALPIDYVSYSGSLPGADEQSASTSTCLAPSS